MKCDQLVLEHLISTITIRHGHMAIPSINQYMQLKLTRKEIFQQKGSKCGFNVSQPTTTGPGSCNIELAQAESRESNAACLTAHLREGLHNESRHAKAHCKTRRNCCSCRLYYQRTACGRFNGRFHLENEKEKRRYIENLQILNQKH